MIHEEKIDKTISVVEYVFGFCDGRPVGHSCRLIFDFWKTANQELKEITLYPGVHDFLVRSIGLSPLDIDEWPISKFVRFVMMSRMEVQIGSKSYLEVPGQYAMSPLGAPYNFQHPLIIPRYYNLHVRFDHYPKFILTKKRPRVGIRCSFNAARFVPGTAPDGIGVQFRGRRA